jgi:hypothetical protein
MTEVEVHRVRGPLSTNRAVRKVHTARWYPEGAGYWVTDCKKILPIEEGGAVITDDAEDCEACVIGRGASAARREKIQPRVECGQPRTKRWEEGQPCLRLVRPGSDRCGYHERSAA